MMYDSCIHTFLRASAISLSTCSPHRAHHSFLECQRGAPWQRWRPASWEHPSLTPRGCVYQRRGFGTAEGMQSQREGSECLCGRRAEGSEREVKAWIRWERWFRCTPYTVYIHLSTQITGLKWRICFDLKVGRGYRLLWFYIHWFHIKIHPSS